jgi:hypothetical protein
MLAIVLWQHARPNPDPDVEPGRGFAVEAPRYPEWRNDVLKRHS